MHYAGSKRLFDAKGTKLMGRFLLFRLFFTSLPIVRLLCQGHADILSAWVLKHDWWCLKMRCVHCYEQKWCGNHLYENSNYKNAVRSAMPACRFRTTVVLSGTFCVVVDRKHVSPDMTTIPKLFAGLPNISCFKVDRSKIRQSDFSAGSVLLAGN